MKTSVMDYVVMIANDKVKKNVLIIEKKDRILINLIGSRANYGKFN